MAITHAYVSTKSDPTDTTLVGKTKWNSNHVDSLDVTAYGTVGNGVADDRAAVVAAIAAVASAGGGELYFPPGTYTTASGTAVTVPANVSLVGSGWATTWLNMRLVFGSYQHHKGMKLGISGYSLRFPSADTTETDVHFSDCYFYGGGGATSSTESKVFDISLSRVNHMSFNRCTCGISQATAATNQWAGGISVVHYGDASDNPEYHDLVWRDCHFLAQPTATQLGISISGSSSGATALFDGIVVDGCTFDQQPGTHLALSYGGDIPNSNLIKAVKIVNNTFHGATGVTPGPFLINGADTMEVNASPGTFISGNTFYSSYGAVIDYTCDNVTGETAWCSAWDAQNLITGNFFNEVYDNDIDQGGALITVKGGNTVITGNTFRVGRVQSSCIVAASAYNCIIGQNAITDIAGKGTPIRIDKGTSHHNVIVANAVQSPVVAPIIEASVPDLATFHVGTALATRSSGWTWGPAGSDITFSAATQKLKVTTDATHTVSCYPADNGGDGWVKCTAGDTFDLYAYIELTAINGSSGFRCGVYYKYITGGEWTNCSPSNDRLLRTEVAGDAEYTMVLTAPANCIALMPAMWWGDGASGECTAYVHGMRIVPKSPATFRAGEGNVLEHNLVWVS